jgi:hypothetical protein
LFLECACQVNGAIRFPKCSSLACIKSSLQLNTRERAALRPANSEDSNLVFVHREKRAENLWTFAEVMLANLDSRFATLAGQRTALRIPFQRLQ